MRVLKSLIGYRKLSASQSHLLCYYKLAINETVKISNDFSNVLVTRLLTSAD